MQSDSERLPTASLLHRTMRESHQYWVERSRNEEKRRALVLQVRELLLRLWQKRCVFAHDRLQHSLCSYDERLENMGCAHPEVDEGEGPEILSAAGFALRDLGVISEQHRVQIATAVMEGRFALRDFDYLAQGRKWELPVLHQGQDEVLTQKEAVRKGILVRIAEFLGENA